MKKFSGGLYKFCKVAAYAGAVIILVMMMATVIDVFCRKIIMHTYPGATEIVSYLLTAVVYFGVGYCAMERGMITIDLFKPHKIITAISNIICVAVGAVIVYATTVQAFASNAVGGSSLRLQIPKWPFMLVTAFGFLMMCIILVIHTIEDLQAKPVGEAPQNSKGVEGQ